MPMHTYESSRRYYLAHRDEKLAYQRAYYQEHRKEMIAKVKECRNRRVEREKAKLLQR